jgi:penicillin-binding protein 1A
VVQHGTAVAAQVLGRPIGGKTGTTNDFRSAWFMGFSPQIVVGVFVGFDDNRSLGKGETGAVAALPIFIEFMQEALKGLPKVDFKAPENAKIVWVGGNREAFRPGTEPRVVQPTTLAPGEAPPIGGVLPPGAPGPVTPTAPAAVPPPARPLARPPDSMRIPF